MFNCEQWTRFVSYNSKSIGGDCADRYEIIVKSKSIAEIVRDLRESRDLPHPKDDCVRLRMRRATPRVRPPLDLARRWAFHFR